jgi:hypothetical protein
MWSPAVGQIGGAINKAKKTATEAAVPASPAEKGCTKPEFNDAILELTADRISKVMKGVEVSRTEAGPAGATAAQLMARADTAYAERDKLLDGKEQQVSKYDEANQKSQSCRSSVIDSLGEVRSAGMQARVMTMLQTDPAGFQEFQNLTMQAQQKYLAGDTAGGRKATEEASRKMGIDPAADTAAAEKVCKRPVKPAWLARADSLELLGSKLVEDARALEQRARAKGAAAAGMNEQQFVIARERILAFIQADGAPSYSWCFSAKEREALTARMKNLQAMDFQ